MKFTKKTILYALEKPSSSHPDHLEEKLVFVCTGQKIAKDYLGDDFKRACDEFWVMLYNPDHTVVDHWCLNKEKLLNRFTLVECCRSYLE